MKSYEFTVGEAISKYGGGRTELLGAWEAVKDVWEEIREGIHPEECHAAQEFERDLVKLDDGTPLRVLVGTEEDRNRGGELFRVIKDGLAPIQDNFLVKCETKYADLFSANPRAPPLSLESLVDPNAAAAAAVQLVAYDSERLMSELCAFVQDENGAFDGESVARYIMWTQVQGKPRIDTGKTSFRWKSIV